MTEYFLLWENYCALNPQPEGAFDCEGEWHGDSNVDGNIEYIVSLGEIGESDASLIEQYANSFKWVQKTDDLTAMKHFETHYGRQVIFTDDADDRDNIEGRDEVVEEGDDQHYILKHFWVRPLDKIDHARFVDTLARFDDDEKSENPLFKHVREIMRRCQQRCNEIRDGEKADHNAIAERPSAACASVGTDGVVTTDKIAAPPARAKYESNSRRNALIISRWKAHHKSCGLDRRTLDDLIDWWEEVLSDDEKSENRVPEGDWSFKGSDGWDSRARDKIRKAIKRSIG